MLLGSLVPTFRRNILPLSRRYTGQSAIPRGIVTDKTIIKICSITTSTTNYTTRNTKFRKYFTQHRNEFYEQYKEMVWNIAKKVVGTV